MNQRPNKPFIHDKAARRRGIKQRIAIYELDEGLLAAKNGNNEPLAAYLRGGGSITQKRHLNALADLIAPPKRNRGRPPGRDRSERAEAVRSIEYMVRVLERKWHKQNPNGTFRNVRRKLIRQVFDMPCEDGSFGFVDPITEDEVYKALTVGGSSLRKNRN